MRNAFVEELVSLARKHEHIALVVGDLGFSVVEPFAREFPDRFINAGIAEQNMAGLAAGMASEGFHVFTYSIANFPTFRCAEQIRNDIDYHKLSVTTVAVGGGVAYGALGYSHHAVQDYALMRSMPNTAIAAPCDPVETKSILRWLVEDYKGPSYLRLGKSGETTIHKNIPRIELNGLLPVFENDSSATAIVSTGWVTSMVDQISRLQPCQQFDWFTVPVWSERSLHSQFDILSKYQQLVTCETHISAGGFGEWINRMVADKAKVRNICLSYDVMSTVAKEQTILRSTVDNWIETFK